MPGDEEEGARGSPVVEGEEQYWVVEDARVDGDGSGGVSARYLLLSGKVVDCAG